MSSEIMDAEHPGELSTDEAWSGTSKAKTWYNEAVRYTARLYVESAQEHAAVREALLDDDGDIVDPQRAMQAHDRERHQEILDLGLSAFQGLSAEQAARRHLED